MLDEQSGESLARGNCPAQRAGLGFGSTSPGQTAVVGARPLDSGGASRFFYCAKASRAERNRGVEDTFWKRVKDRPAGYVEVGRAEWEELGREEERIFKETGKRVSLRARGNIHTTVKPVAFMRWLVRIVAPPGGVVLDPFAGSGTTCMAAKAAGFHYVGIELDEDYAEIARRRVAATEGSVFP